MGGGSRGAHGRGLTFSALPLSSQMERLQKVTVLDGVEPNGNA